MLKNKVFPSFVLLSLLIGFVFNEDSLGGGYHDYLYHEKYFFYFSNDFFNSLKNYGMDQVNEGVRNSPVFYMMFSLFLKMGFEIESLKFINLIIIVPIIFFFSVLTLVIKISLQIQNFTYCLYFYYHQQLEHY